MENYIVSARKYRPLTFDSVVGQRALTTTLKNAIASGKLAHAYLFCGPRGVGKTTCARIFARTINCLTPTETGEACGNCESCKAFEQQRSFNIHELDAASNNSVEDIRSLIEQVRMPPQVGRYKVFIIDEVHMLSTAAFNAFLKTLEEPPAHAIFILATTEKHKILPTILSRCQIYDFNRMEVADIGGHRKHVAQQEGYDYEEEALSVIARKADGGMRDALSIFDQVAGYAEGHLTYRKVIEDLNVLDYDYYFKIVDQMLGKNIPAVMLTLNEILSKGFAANHFISGFASHLRDLLVSRDAQTLPLLEVSETVRTRQVPTAVPLSRPPDLQRLRPQLSHVKQQAPSGRTDTHTGGAGGGRRRGRLWAWPYEDTKTPLCCHRSCGGSPPSPEGPTRRNSPATARRYTSGCHCPLRHAARVQYAKHGSRPAPCATRFALHQCHKNAAAPQASQFGQPRPGPPHCHQRGATLRMERPELSVVSLCHGTAARAERHRRTYEKYATTVDGQFCG